MAEKDKVQKTLESYNDVFADIVNGLLFDGEEVIKEQAGGARSGLQAVSPCRVGKGIMNECVALECL